VQQDVIVRQLNVPNHPGVLKKIYECEYISEIFYLYKILEVPIIVANIFWRKTFNS